MTIDSFAEKMPIIPDGTRKLGTDLDDTLWDHASPFFDYCKDVLGYGNGRTDVNLAYNIEKSWGWTRKQLEDAFLGFIANKDRFPILPYPNVRNTLERLQKKNVSLIVITSRGEEHFKLDTEKDLEKYFPKLIERVYYTNDIWLNGEAIVNKKDICKREGVTDFVDDSITNILGVAELEINCYLITREWNTKIKDSELPKNVIKVNGIEEILKYF